MKKGFRKILFWLFFVLFAVTTPLAVFYSLGYRFDFYQKIFVHSGSITIKSTPSGANIFVDGRQQTGSSLDIINNSTTIGGLRPGNYNLRITADGYSSWEKNIEVHSGVSTEFWNIFLVPSSISVNEISSSQNTKRYFVSPFNQKISFVKEVENKIEVWLEDLRNKKSTLLFSGEGIRFSDNELENAEWNIKEKLILNPVWKDGKKDFLVLDAEQQMEPVYLSQIAGSEVIDEARWSPQEEKGIYFLANSDSKGLKNLYFAGLDTKEKTLIAEKVRAYDISSNHLYALAENNILYKLNLDGGGKNQIIASSFPVEETDDLRLIAYDDNRQALIAKKGNLVVHNNGKEDFLKNIASGVRSIQFSDDGKKLLYWSDNEIGVMFLRDWDVQPRREENEIQQIIRFSSPIGNVFWYRDYEHIFFSNAGKVKMIELDPRDRRICFDVLSYNSENFTSSYDSYNGAYYFLDEVNGALNISYFNIPEKKNIFGR